MAVPFGRRPKGRTPRYIWETLWIACRTMSQQGDYSADNYIKTAPFVFSDAYTGPILSWLNPQPGDRIIDLGCGSGELTATIQSAVGAEGFVLGVDYNDDMVCHSCLLGHGRDGDALGVGIDSDEARRQAYACLGCSGS